MEDSRELLSIHRWRDGASPATLRPDPTSEHPLSSEQHPTGQAPFLSPDLPPAEFQAQGHRVIDLIAEYYASLSREAVDRGTAPPAFPAIRPADVAAMFTGAAPEQGESLDTILANWQDR